MKRLLVLSYHYAPFNSMATYRAVAFAQHLPEHGIHPIIVTHTWAKDGEGEHHWHIFQGGALQVEEHPHHTVVRLPLPVGTKPYTPGALRSFSALLAGRFDLGGYLPASHEAYRQFLGSNHPVLQNLDGVLGIFNPHHHLELGAAFAQRQCIPFCADLRDLWSPDAGTTPLYTGWKHRLRERLMLRHWKRWLCQAQVVSTVTPTWANTLQDFLGKPVITVRNGIETGAFDNAANVTPETFTLAYIGSLYPQQDVTPLAQALAALPQSCAWQFHWVGAPSVEAVEEVRQRMAACGVDANRIQGQTRTTRAEALGWMRGAQVLVYPAWPNQPGIIGGKVYEYLASGTPVLITAPNRDQDVVRLAALSDSAAVFTPEEQSALVAWIQDRHQKWSTQSEKPGTQNTTPFERSTQVARWAEVFLQEKKGVKKRGVGSRFRRLLTSTCERHGY